MQLWQDGLLAMLAAVGLASLMWAAVRMVLYPSVSKRRSIAALIPAQGNGGELEQQVRLIRCLRQEQDLFGAVLLVDCGLDKEGQKLAHLLARRERWITVCTADEVSRYIPTFS